MDGWMDGWTDGRMDGWMGAMGCCVVLCVVRVLLQDVLGGHRQQLQPYVTWGTQSLEVGEKNTQNNAKNNTNTPSHHSVELYACHT